MNPFSDRFSRARRKVLLCLLSFAVGIVSSAYASSGKQRYLRRIRFSLNQTVRFPDFTLRYTGKTHVNSPVFAPGFTYENFVVNTGDHEQTVHWCGGTGIPTPAAFKVGGKVFWLELYHSARLGALAPDELVILPTHELGRGQGGRDCASSA